MLAWCPEQRWAGTTAFGTRMLWELPRVQGWADPHGRRWQDQRTISVTVLLLSGCGRLCGCSKHIPQLTLGLWSGPGLSRLASALRGFQTPSLRLFNLGTMSHHRPGTGCGDTGSVSWGTRIHPVPRTIPVKMFQMPLASKLLAGMQAAQGHFHQLQPALPSQHAPPPPTQPPLLELPGPHASWAPVGPHPPAVTQHS